MVQIPSRFGRFLAVAVAIVVAGGLVSILIGGGVDDLLRYSWPLLFIAFAGWALFWQPSVTVSDGGVTIANVLRTIHLPWPSIERVDTKYALTLSTAYGHFAAWAAPAPSRYTVGSTDKSELKRLPDSTFFAGTVRPGDDPGSDSGQAALVVRRRWEHLRDAGYLDEARLEKPRPDVRWHWVTITVFALLGVASVLSLAL